MVLGLQKHCPTPGFHMWLQGLELESASLCVQVFTNGVRPHTILLKALNYTCKSLLPRKVRYA